MSETLTISVRRQTGSLFTPSAMARRFSTPALTLQLDLALPTDAA
ncbi:MAG TPA: hypothetical protein VG388_11735 [Solirubrobacteraceae bacterium]|jgi:hypothetical protein|nr:hypothetical protein [Solirubrobacteraceae bacterium]